MPSEIITDWVVPARPGVQEYIDYIWLTLTKTADRQWLEVPKDTAQCVHLDPVIDLTPHAYHRGVFGYVAFGTWGQVSRDLFDQDPESGYSIIWQDHHFINWRENFYKAPRGCNALRVWLRIANDMFMHGKTYFIDNNLGPGELLVPGGGPKIWPPYPIPGP